MTWAASGCTSPAATSVPPEDESQWSQRGIAVHLGERGLAVSAATVGRVLAEAKVRPHKVRGWLNRADDPAFWLRAGQICRLYLNPPPGTVLISVDEKTGIQAKSRKHPRIPARHGRDARREFEYARHGTISIIAAMNVATGQVIAERIHRNDSAAFTAFLVRRLRAAHMLLHARRVANLELLRKELRRRPRHIQRILQRPARSTNRAQLHREAKAVMVRPAARDQVPAGRRRPGPPGGRRPWPRLLRARPPSRRSAPCRSAPGRPSARRASAAARS